MLLAARIPETLGAPGMRYVSAHVPRQGRMKSIAAAESAWRVISRPLAEEYARRGQMVPAGHASRSPAGPAENYRVESMAELDT